MAERRIINGVLYEKGDDGVIRQVATPASTAPIAIPLPESPRQKAADDRAAAAEARANRADARAQASFDKEDAGAALDPQTISYYAQSVLAGQPMPALGMGKQAAAARQAIMREVASQAGAKGLSGADLARQIAHFKAGSKQLGTLETMLGTIRQNEQTALLNGQQFIERSADLPGQTGMPIVNSIVQGAQRNLPVPGHAAIAAHDAAWNTFVNEYAKVVSGSPSGAGTMSDSARREAMATMRGNYSLDQKKVAFDQMKQDMENRITAIHKGINEGYQHLTQTPGYEVPETTTALAVAKARDDRSGMPPAGMGGNNPTPPPDNSPPGLPPANMPGGNQPSPWTDPSTGQTVATGGTRSIAHPEISSMVASMVNAGAGYSTINAALQQKGRPPLSFAEFGAVQKWMKQNPGKAYPASAVDATTTEPLTMLQRAAGSTPGAFIANMANSATLGIPAAISGAQAQGALAAMDAMSPNASLWGGLTGDLTGIALQGLGAGAALSKFPALAKAVASPLGTLGTGAAYGAATGAIANNDDRGAGAVEGALGGLAGGALGRYAVAPIAERLLRSRAGVEGLTAAERALPMNDPQVPANVTANLQDAANLNLPYSLADADPKLRMLAGSVARKSPDARQLAEMIFDPRARGQAERAVAAIDQHLAPITDIEKRGADLLKAGNVASGPSYNLARARPGPVDPQIDAMLETPAGKEALAHARTLAGNEGRDPNTLGFDLNDQGEVVLRDVPSFETLQYVKRGLDQVVEGKRNALGQLDLQGDPMAKAVNGLRGRFNQRLGELNPDYAAANAEYANFAQRKDALEMGHKTLPNTGVPYRQFEAGVAGLTPETLPEARMGYATSMGDTVDKARLSANPYDSVYGSPLQQRKVGALFPEGAPNFDRTYNLEGDMAKTRTETLGGSPTQARNMADQLFDTPAGTALDAGIQLYTGGGVSPKAGLKLLQMVKDNYKLGVGQKKADALAPVLFNTDPQQTLDYLADYLTRRAALAARQQNYGSKGALLGALMSPSLMPSQ